MTPKFHARPRQYCPDPELGSRVFNWCGALWRDIAQAARMLRRNSTFPALAILTLALGVGLTAVMGSVLNGTLWHPLNPTIPIVNVRPLEDYVRASLLQPRFNMLLLGIFAATAIFLTMTGLYAVVAYAALRRRREFSIRRALGATERKIAWMVIRQGLQAIIPGIAFGLAGALASNTILQSVLYGIQPNQPATLLIATLGAASISLLAILQPAFAAGNEDLRPTLQSDTDKYF